MKLALLTFGCDTCSEESPHESTWREARRSAKDDGWRLGPDGAATCPDCLSETPDDPTHSDEIETLVKKEANSGE